MILVISNFGLERGICLLIAPVPVHCFLIGFPHILFPCFTSGLSNEILNLLAMPVAECPDIPFPGYSIKRTSPVQYSLAIQLAEVPP